MCACTLSWTAFIFFLPKQLAAVMPAKCAFTTTETNESCLPYRLQLCTTHCFTPSCFAGTRHLLQAPAVTPKPSPKLPSPSPRPPSPAPKPAAIGVSALPGGGVIISQSVTNNNNNNNDFGEQAHRMPSLHVPFDLLKGAIGACVHCGIAHACNYVGMST